MTTDLGRPGPRRPGRPRRRATGAGAAVLALFLAACGAGPAPTAPAAAPSPASSTAVGPARPGAVATARPSAADPFADLPGPQPLPSRAAVGVRRIVVPAIGVDSPLETLRLDSAGVLQAPANPDMVGWYAGGTVPGDPGPAVIAGHVDSQSGPAVFYDLKNLAPGSVVAVTRTDGRTVRFRVDAVDQYPKDNFPTDAVYGATPDPSLRLITCGGTFDYARHHYRDNVVAYASLVE